MSDNSKSSTASLSLWAFFSDSEKRLVRSSARPPVLGSMGRVSCDIELSVDNVQGGIMEATGSQ